MLVVSSVWLFATPMDYSPSGSPVHGILQARRLGMVCHLLLQGNLPGPGIEPESPLSLDRQILYCWAVGKPNGSHRKLPAIPMGWSKLNFSLPATVRYPCVRVRSESVLLSRTDLSSIGLRTPMSKQWKHPEEGPGRHREPVTQGASWWHYHTSEMKSLSRVRLFLQSHAL